MTITLLVKNPNIKTEKATIHYYDIGDYLDRAEKLNIVKSIKSFINSQVTFKTLLPNEHGDWVYQRSDLFSTFIPIEPEKKFDLKATSYFIINSLGVNSNRDAWVYNSSKSTLLKNMGVMVDFYNTQVDAWVSSNKTSEKRIEDIVEKDPKLISWSSSLVSHLGRGQKAFYDKNEVVISCYRPFYKQYLYIGDKMIHRRGQMKELFLRANTGENLFISVSGCF